MPRKARIDTASALHHIICRGIERREIFKDNIDRSNFVDRLGKILSETKTPCFAWALIPNHFHLNPLRAKIVSNVDELDRYPYSGHSRLMGYKKDEWQDVDYVFSFFGKRVSQACIGVGPSYLVDFSR